MLLAGIVNQLSAINKVKHAVMDVMRCLLAEDILIENGILGERGRWSVSWSMTRKTHSTAFCSIAMPCSFVQVPVVTSY